MRRAPVPSKYKNGNYRSEAGCHRAPKARTRRTRVQSAREDPRGRQAEPVLSQYNDDYDEDQVISDSDAADIWLSHGMDEDYTFGHTEDELAEPLPGTNWPLCVLHGITSSVRA